MQGFGLILAAALLCFGAFLNTVVLVYLVARTLLTYSAQAKRKKASAILALAGMHR